MSLYTKVRKGEQCIQRPIRFHEELLLQTRELVCYPNNRQACSGFERTVNRPTKCNTKVKYRYLALLQTTRMV